MTGPVFEFGTNGLPPPQSDGRLDAPAFHRNCEPIWQAMRSFLIGKTGAVLEIGSGTGQHAVTYAARTPHLTWWPSDISPVHRASIEAWGHDANLPNLRAPQSIDLMTADWCWHGDSDGEKLAAILCFNVLHIAPWRVAENLFAGAGRVLGDGGHLLLYGPYKRDGVHTAPSNADFDVSLRTRNPEWGVRDLADIAVFGENKWPKARQDHRHAGQQSDAGLHALTRHFIADGCTGGQSRPLHRVVIDRSRKLTRSAHRQIPGGIPMRISSAAAILSLALIHPAIADEPYAASLAGHVIIPAETFITAPADAPADLKNAGKFTTGKRVEAVGTVMGTSAGRPTGVKLPFKGQPIQGHSGIKRMADGTFWVLTDNGSGAKANSPDSMLYMNRWRMDWAKGTAERVETIFFHDADKKVPFRIANEGTDKRYLTGSDFDLESFQPIGDKIWLAEEFGPYLIRADRTGKVEAVFETMVDGKPARSPDHFAITAPATPTTPVVFNVRRSKGYEGMAASPDGKFLYALLEGALWDADKKDLEKTADGKEYLRIVEFDVAGEKWTGRHWKYVLEANGLAIGDFNMINATTGLIIERDNGEGTVDKACAQGQQKPDCFHDLAKLKRIYKIELTDANAGGPVRKIGHIDLMKIADPDKKARKPLNDGVLTFPFFTIENVDIVDAQHIIVGNDNNLPFSSSREPNKADDNEFVLLRVDDFLKAK